MTGRAAARRAAAGGVPGGCRRARRVASLFETTARRTRAGYAATFATRAPRQALAGEFGATDIVSEGGDEGAARIKQLTKGVVATPLRPRRRSSCPSARLPRGTVPHPWRGSRARRRQDLCSTRPTLRSARVVGDEISPRVRLRSEGG